MNKKSYIIPQTNSRHLILGGALAQMPVFDEPVSGGSGFVKEREVEVEESEGWDEKGLW